MRKLLRRFILVLIVLLLLLVAAGPKVIGYFTEDIYRQLVADQDQASNRYTLSLRDYHSGWFGSDARIRIEITDPDLRQRIDNLFGRGTRLQLVDRLAHGPVPLRNADWRPALVSGRLTVEVLPGGAGARSLAEVRYLLALDGGLSGTMQSSPLDLATSGGGRLRMDPVDAQFQAAADGARFSLSGSHGSIVDSGRATLEIGPGEFSLTGGSVAQRLDSSAAFVTYADAADGRIRLDGVHLSGVSNHSGGLIDAGLTLTADRLSGAFEASDLSARARLERVDAAALDSARTRARRQLRDARLNPVSIIGGAVLGELPNFLGPRPRLFLGPLRARVNGQQLALEGQVGVIDGAINTSPLYAWRSLDGQLAANLPRPVVDWLVETLDLRGGLSSLIDTGVLIPARTDQYLLDVTLQSGIVTLNGMTFEPDVGRLLR